MDNTIQICSQVGRVKGTGLSKQKEIAVLGGLFWFAKLEEKMKEADQALGQIGAISFETIGILNEERDKARGEYQIDIYMQMLKAAKARLQGREKESVEKMESIMHAVEAEFVHAFKELSPAAERFYKKIEASPAIQQERSLTRRILKSLGKIIAALKNSPNLSGRVKKQLRDNFSVKGIQELVSRACVLAEKKQVEPLFWSKQLVKKPYTYTAGAAAVTGALALTFNLLAHSELSKAEEEETHDGALPHVENVGTYNDTATGLAVSFGVLAAGTLVWGLIDYFSGSKENSDSGISSAMYRNGAWSVSWE